MTAYDFTLQALNLFHHVDKASHQEARRLLLKAVEHDSNYALAHSHLAYLRMAWIGQGWSSDEAADVLLAAASAETAIRHDPNEPLALAIFGHVQSYGFKNYGVARDFLDRALACGPSCAWAWSLSGLTHAYMQNFSMAIDHTEKAIRLAPIGTEAYWFEHYLSIAYYFDERYNDAVAWGRWSAAHAVGNLSNLRVLAAAHVGAGEMDEARAVIARLLSLDPTHRAGRVRARTPFPGEIRTRFVEQLKAAGLPE
jgi:tetratricopeptide (TPR) repeat protein